MLSSGTSPSGFSLLEVTIASAIMAGALLSAAHLFAAATVSTAAARAVGEATVLAWQKLEQLRALAFTSDDAGQPVTDTSTDTAASPERAAGGTGLSPAAGTLRRDTAGYVDYLDGFGEPLGGGGPPGGGDAVPAGARYRRRWQIEASDGGDVLVVRVHVLLVGSDAVAAGVVSLRSRKRP